MERQLIKHPRLSVRHFTGREGPRHDPYGFDEYLVTTPKGHLVAHVGLAVFVIKGKERTDARGEDYDNAHGWVDKHLEEWCGFNMRQIQRIHDEVTRRCPKGGYHMGTYESGYPGESFCVCGKCGKMYDFSFDIEAVM